MTTTDDANTDRLFFAPLCEGLWFDAEPEVFAWTKARWAAGGAKPFGDYRPAAMKTLAMPFYRGTALAEIALEHPNGAIAYADALIGPYGFMPIDGTAPPIHALNRRCKLKLEDEFLAALYLRFFANAVRGEDRFTLLENSEMARCFIADATPAFINGIVPLVMEETDTGWQTMVMVIYQGHVFETRFAVREDGNVEMLDDTPLDTDGMSIAVERFEGHLRIWDKPPAYARRIVA